MKTRSPLVLSKNVNWPELAATVKYQAPLLAAHFNVSLRTLEREFQKQLHTSPQKKLDTCRQSAAEKLVRDGARTKEIAFELGYKTVPHFCRHWSDLHGMGVRAWRNFAS